MKKRFIIAESNLSPLEKMQALDRGEYRNINAMSDLKLYQNQAICQRFGLWNALDKIETRMVQKGLIDKTTRQKAAASAANQKSINDNDENKLIAELTELANNSILTEKDFEQNFETTLDNFTLSTKELVINLIFNIVLKNVKAVDAVMESYFNTQEKKELLKSIINQVLHNEKILATLNAKNSKIESLNEDTNTAKSIIADQIRGEWEAIQNYNKAVAELKDSNIEQKNIDDAEKILTDITDEEKVHVGELETTLSKIDQNLEDKVAEGKQEADEKLEKLGEALNDANKTLFEKIEKHDTLNQKLFDENQKLKSDVREKILEIVKEFIDGLKEDNIDIVVNDIVLVGSNCSYNYNNNSDLDIHIQADMQNLHCPYNLYPLLYSAYRSIFNKTFDISFYGIPVEIFVETVEDELDNTEKEQKLVSNGIYSVLNDSWIKEPIAADIPDINQEDVDAELQPWIERYMEITADDSESSLSDKISNIEKYIEEIYNLRRQSISTDGEYGIGNLVFKELREKGYLDELKQLKHELKSKSLSLESLSLTESKQDELNFKTWLNNDEYANLFLKFRQGFKQPENDYYYWIKNKQPEDLIKFIDNYQQQKRSKEEEHQEIMQGAEYLGEGNGFKVYHITTWEASKTLGQGAKWCISMKDNSQYWKDYTKKGVKFYFFISSKTKYALAVYPKEAVLSHLMNYSGIGCKNAYLLKVNFEIFNAEDKLVYQIIDHLPIKLIPEQLTMEKADYDDTTGLAIKNNNTLVKAVQDILACDIPNNITAISNNAFASCLFLSSITIPNSVTSIGDYAFSDCTSLSNVEISDSVTSIGDGTFTNCISLTSINIPNSVTSIGYGAFGYCTSLKSITIPNSITKIGKDAFYGCYKLTNVYYTGSEEEWNRIKIGLNNELISATIHYNSKIGESLEMSNFESLQEVLEKNRHEWANKLSQISRNQAIIHDNGLFNIYLVKEDDVDRIIHRIRDLDFIEWVQKTAGQFDFSQAVIYGPQKRYYTIYGKIK